MEETTNANVNKNSETANIEGIVHYDVPPPPKRERKWTVNRKNIDRKGFFFYLVNVAVCTIIALFLITFIFSTKYFFVQVHGESMIPTFQDNDLVLFNKIDKPKTNNIVIFSIPDPWLKVWKGNPNDRFIKRIKAVSGDELSWDGNVWYVNGKAFSSVKTGECDVAPTKITLQTNQIFVIGDTEDGVTMDSRQAFCDHLDYFVPTQNIINTGTVAKIF